MIVAKKSKASEEDFSSLLSRTRGSILDTIKEKKTTPSEFNSLSFENVVFDHTCNSARGTIFENTIERRGLHAFPDIIAKKYYGIEVKTTTGRGHYRTVGFFNKNNEYLR